MRQEEQSLDDTNVEDTVASLTAQACDVSCSGGWSRESKVQGLPKLQSEFKACSGNLVKPCLSLKSANRMGIQFSGRTLV